MIHFDNGSSLYIDEQDSGYVSELTNKYKIFNTQFDFLLLGFCYAVRNGFQPLKTIQRHDLRRVAGLKPETILLMESVASWYAKKTGHVLGDAGQLLDFICRLGSTGIRELRKDWEGRDIAQIELRIMNLGKNALEETSQRN